MRDPASMANGKTNACHGLGRRTRTQQWLTPACRRQVCSKIDLGRDPYVVLCEGLTMVCGAWVSVLAAVLHQPKAANAMCGPVGPGIEFRSLLQGLGGRQRRMCCRCITANRRQTALAAKPADEAGELLAHGVLLSRRAGTERTSSAAWSPADRKWPQRRTSSFQ